VNGPHDRLVFGESGVQAGNTRNLVVMEYFFVMAVIVAACDEDLAAAQN
jgi:hypothetical protein